MSQLKKALVAVILVVIIIAGLGYFLYTEYQKVQAARNLKIYLVDAYPVSIGLTSATLELKLRIYNPTDVTITIEGIDYTLYGDGNRVGEGSIYGRLEIPARGSKIVTSRFDVTYAGLARTVLDFILSGGRLTWRVTGYIYVSTLFGTQTVYFEATIE